MPVMYALNDAAKESLVTDLDLKVNGGLMEFSGSGDSFTRVWYILEDEVEFGPEIFCIFFQAIDHLDVLEPGFIETVPDFLCVLDGIVVVVVVFSTGRLWLGLLSRNL
jgi:hypothetical protein